MLIQRKVEIIENILWHFNIILEIKYTLKCTKPQPYCTKPSPTFTIFILIQLCYNSFFYFPSIAHNMLYLKNYWPQKHWISSFLFFRTYETKVTFCVTYGFMKFTLLQVLNNRGQWGKISFILVFFAKKICPPSRCIVLVFFLFC